MDISGIHLPNTVVITIPELQTLCLGTLAPCKGLLAYPEGAECVNTVKFGPEVRTYFDWAVRGAPGYAMRNHKALVFGATLPSILCRMLYQRSPEPPRRFGSFQTSGPLI